MRKPRRLTPESYWEITARCARTEFRLRPDAARTEGLGYYLARALAACPGIRLLCVGHMSNHFHLVLRDDSAELSKFMCLFEGPLAKYINELDGARGQVFERRFAGIEAIDKAAVLDRIAYAVVNPVDADLVEHLEDWPGLIAWPGQKLDQTFALTRHLGPARLPEDEYSLEIAREILSPEDLLWLEAEIQRRIETLAEERDGRPVLGREAVLAQDPFDAPSDSKRSPLPACHASSVEDWLDYVRESKLFVKAYRIASAAFRAGELNTHFPPFSFRPWSSTFASLTVL